jgi:hypothetical protein
MLVVCYFISYEQVQAVVKKYDILFIADEVLNTPYKINNVKNEGKKNTTYVQMLSTDNSF